MALTQSPGPIAAQPGPTNFTVDGPAHKLLLTPFPRRLRAELGGELVLDTTGAQLVHETGLLAALYVPEADVRAELLSPTDTRTHCPFKGDASYLAVKDVPDVFWTYREPNPEAAWLEGLLGVYFRKLDRWLDEDEEIHTHVRDPYHRVDARRSSRHVRVTVDGEVVAETRRPVVLSETGMPNRLYVPREDVRVELVRSATTTHCPYKGEATYWSAPGREDLAWSFEAPFVDALPAQGMLSFWGDGVVVELDGVAVPA
ncbi:DUF427 domain-containing protein [Conexibacter sp. SYSU D00693]|uniref:DUF427 domain-containing protein n=1 Tax=Conexibacter sp. SYSU D00693 TaxID=2812560 RepID=UPI00196B378D|nr:DUF427 domain-containing protein [Conexibacter sp. SYSU D00693]